MADELYALTKADVDVLRKIVAAYRRGDLNRPLQNRRRTLPPRDSVMYGLPVAGLNGTTDSADPANGDFDIYNLSTDGSTWSGRTETVYNLYPTAIGMAEMTVCVRDHESGSWLAIPPGGTGHKPFCRFVLDADLTDATTSCAALLTNQWGEGTAHSTGSITVYNPLDGYTTGCLFEGSSGTAGIAGYNSGTSWVIIQLFKYCT